jgi:hypothetical protein
MEEIIENYEEPVKKSRKPRKKKTVDELIFNDNEEVYKNKLRVYVLSGQIKDLYGKIITEHELNNMQESECENIYKICEMKTATNISDNVIHGLVTVVGNLCSKILPIDDKDKYTTDLKNDYILNSELKNVAGNVAMRTGKLMGLLSFLIITGSHINFFSSTVKEHDKELDEELDKELEKELDK